MRDYNKSSRYSYNKKAKNYNDTIDGKFTLPFKNKLVELIKTNKNDKLLDVACGNGELLYQISKHNEIIGYGIDIAEEMIKEAKKKCPQFKFTVGDSAMLPFPDNFFDIITVSASFHHFPKPDKFMLEAARVLKNNGKIYIADIYAPIILRQVFNVFLPLSNEGDKKFYSKREMLHFCNRVKLKNVSITHERHIQITIAQKVN